MAGAEVTINVALPSAALAREPVAAVDRRLRLLWSLKEIRAEPNHARSGCWCLGLPLDESLPRADDHGLPAFDYDPDDFEFGLASLT